MSIYVTRISLKVKTRFSVNGIDVKDYDILVAVQISKEFSYDNIRITKERTNYTEWKGRTSR